MGAVLYANVPASVFGDDPAVKLCIKEINFKIYISESSKWRSLRQASYRVVLIALIKVVV